MRCGAAGGRFTPPSASSRRSGGRRELDDYLGFLAGGCAKDPLDLLRDAGVDLQQPAAVDTALGEFGAMVDELDQFL
jgi:oligoendopeptidase F